MKNDYRIGRFGVRWPKPRNSREAMRFGAEQGFLLGNLFALPVFLVWLLGHFVGWWS